MALGTRLRRMGLAPAVKTCDRGLRKLSADGHRLQFQCEWERGETPEWFDHVIDQPWKWQVTRNPLSWERGFFS